MRQARVKSIKAAIDVRLRYKYPEKRLESGVPRYRAHGWGIEVVLIHQPDQFVPSASLVAQSEHNAGRQTVLETEGPFVNIAIRSIWKSAPDLYRCAIGSSRVRVNPKREFRVHRIAAGRFACSERVENKTIIVRAGRDTAAIIVTGQEWWVPASVGKQGFRNTVIEHPKASAHHQLLAEKCW